MEDKERLEEERESNEGCSTDEEGGKALATDLHEELHRLRAIVDAKTKEAEENHHRFLRAVADLENYKKRAEKEKSEIVQFANEELIKGLLPVLDNLERALEHADKTKDLESLKEGVRLTLGQMYSILEGFGLTRIEALGERFDPSRHEALSHEETGEHESGTVIKEFQRGYYLKKKLLRPSLVAVAKEPLKEEKKGCDTDT